MRAGPGGRFAPEKRQDVLIRGVRRSRRGARVQLHFAGHGPAGRRLRRLISKLLGGVAVPGTTAGLPLFFNQLELFLAKGRIGHFFPEGELVPYDTSLRDFKRGVFHLAAQARVPVLPLSIRFTPPTGLRRLLRRKPTMVIVIGEPIVPTMTDPRRDRSIRMELSRRRTQDQITPAAS